MGHYEKVHKDHTAWLSGPHYIIGPDYYGGICSNDLFEMKAMKGMKELKGNVVNHD